MKRTALYLTIAFLLAACTTSDPSQAGQGETRATAAQWQSKATAGDGPDAPLNANAGVVPQAVSVPMIAWNNDAKKWEAVLGPDGKPLYVTGEAGSFNYTTAGSISNTATVSGTAGPQTQSSTPSNTVSPQTTVTPTGK